MRVEKLKKFKRASLAVQMKKTYFSKPQGDEYNFYYGGSPRGMQESSERPRIFDLTSVRKVAHEYMQMRVPRLDLSDVSNIVTEAMSNNERHNTIV